MKKELLTISTVGMSREKWLEERRKSIGGSDAAGILGLNPYISPLSVYMDKKGISPEREDNLAMELGRELEEFVAKKFESETGKKVRRRNAIIRDPRMPFAHANVDRVVVGEDAILECKTTSELNLKRYKGGEYPPTYYVQVMHYMMVTGAQKAYIAVLIGNRDFRIFEVERNEDEIESLRAQEQAFYENYLLPSTMPDPSGSERDEALLKAEYPVETSDGALDLSDMTACFEAYIAANAQKAVCERIIDKAKQDIEARLGNASTGYCGGHKVTWKTQTRNDIDKAALKDMGIDIPYKQTTSRTFRFTAAK